MEKVEYWIDDFNNKWDCSKYTKEEAIKASSTLINCYDCINCDNCLNCSDCVSCSECLDCMDCVKCINCTSCKILKKEN